MGNQNSALLEAASAGDTSKAQKLLETVEVNWKGQDGWTALHYAACNGHSAVARTLPDHTADVNTTAQDGRTPLHLAARNGHSEVVADLLKAGANADAADHDGMTALLRAAANGHTRAAGELIWGHANVNTQMQDGATALHLAAWYGHPSLVQLLLQREAQLDVRDSKGCTPLHGAVAEGHDSVVKQLMRAHADQSIVDDCGKSAADVARDHGHTHMVSYLTQHTDRLTTHSSLPSAPTALAPSAPPLPASEYNSTLHQSSLCHQSSSQHQSPSQHQSSPRHGSGPQLARSASVGVAPSGGRTHAVGYPVIFGASSPSQDPPRALSRAADSSGLLPARAASLQENGEQSGSASDMRQSQPVHPDAAPRPGYVSGALSVIGSNLPGWAKAVLPEMLQPSAAPSHAAGGFQAEVVESSRQQQQSLRHSGPYGLLDDHDDGDHEVMQTAEDEQVDEVLQILQDTHLQDQESAPGQSLNQSSAQRTACQLITQRDLSAMCNGFDSNNLLRHSKSTYRSRLHNIPVVVTLLPHSSQPRAVLQQWLDGISQLSHPHVLPVVAACLEPAAVICPLVKNGSLDGALRGQPTPDGRPSPSLQWHHRIHLASACADALVYLHSHAPQPDLASGVNCPQLDVIHRTYQPWLHERLHPSNILLADDLLPQLSGITCPALLDTPAGGAQVTIEADVYALGMTMLQLLTGREAQATLRDDVQRQLQRRSLPDWIDPCSGMWPAKQAEQFAGLALRCTCTGAGQKPRLADDILPQLTALAASAHPPHLASSSSAPSQGLWGQQSSEPPLFVCPISLEIMKDPVVAADGQTYDRLFIQQWFSGGNITSPMSSAILPHTSLLPNFSIKSAIKDWQEHQAS